MCIHLKFDFKKATQTLNFFANKFNGRISKLHALKLIFLADRYHFRKFSRPITMDQYFAMKRGSVASMTKNIADLNEEYLSANMLEYAMKFIKKSPPYYIESTQDIDYGELSESDVEALNFIFSKFGKLTPDQLTKLTHNYPEWQKHEKTIEKTGRAEMSYEDFLDEPYTGEECFPLKSEEKEDLKEFLEEESRITALWS